MNAATTTPLIIPNLLPPQTLDDQAPASANGNCSC
jgi:hypothetical protein